MKLTGVLEVFKNKNGYVTGVFKSWDEKAKEVKGKAYMDVKLPDDVKIEDGQTLTLDVKEGYLNAYYVFGLKPFTKLKINVVECEVTKVFPIPEIKKTKKSTRKEAK